MSHATPREHAKQKVVAKHLRDDNLCACSTYLNENHHHCAVCGFPIHHSDLVCAECEPESP